MPKNPRRNLDKKYIPKDAKRNNVWGCSFATALVYCLNLVPDFEKYTGTDAILVSTTVLDFQRVPRALLPFISSKLKYVKSFVRSRSCLSTSLALTFCESMRRTAVRPYQCGLTCQSCILRWKYRDDLAVMLLGTGEYVVGTRNRTWTFARSFLSTTSPY